MKTKISRDEALQFLAAYPALTRAERLVSFCHLTGTSTLHAGVILGISAEAVRKRLQRARAKIAAQHSLEANTDLVSEPPQWSYVETRRLIGAMSVKNSIVDLGEGLAGRPLTEFDVAQLIFESSERRRILPGPLAGRKLGEEKCSVIVDETSRY